MKQKVKKVQRGAEGILLVETPHSQVADLDKKKTNERHNLVASGSDEILGRRPYL